MAGQPCYNSARCKTVWAAQARWMRRGADCQWLRNLRQEDEKSGCWDAACRLRDAGPVHAVSVSAFWMAQATVSSHDLELFSVQQGLKLRPGDVTLRIADAYTHWLSQATGKKYRLPTEAEV